MHATSLLPAFLTTCLLWGHAAKLSYLSLRSIAAARWDAGLFVRKFFRKQQSQTCDCHVWWVGWLASLADHCWSNRSKRGTCACKRPMWPLQMQLCY
jgi:hypothetical protein